jgi:putative IMPACT (imprinted ancient) family translation regulator
LESNSSTRYSDDGEPSGTAGRPILEAIDGAGVTNVLVVITRYYGGIKLGTGGLARAYRDTATATLKEARIVEELIYQRFRLAFSHDDTSIVMHMLAESGIRPEQTDYADSVIITARIRQSHYETLQTQLLNRTRGRARVEPLAQPEEDEI